jgi:RNA polymerase sigma factor (sigma-70 family)
VEDTVPTGQHNGVRELLRQLRLRADGTGLTDSELLDRFVTRREEAAFAELLRRHGAMVLGVCRRVLHNEADAEDAFQATFLVLVRKARLIMPRALVSNWLYGVAHTTALKARAMNMRRRAKEREAGVRARPAAAAEIWQDVEECLDRELSGLPEKYRIPVLLCDIESRPIKEAARQLGWPQGTVASRLARARVMLAKRLRRHGLTFSGGALAMALSAHAAPASVPIALAISTKQAASLAAAGQALATGAISSQAAALTEGVLKAMLLTKLGNLIVGCLLTTVLAVGAVLLLSASQAEGLKAQKEHNPRHKPAVLATARDLVSIYHTNDALGDEKFADRLVRVTGQMIAVRRSAGVKGSYVMELSPEFLRTVILLEFDLKARKQLAKIDGGQQVTVEGRCEGRVPRDGRDAILFRDCTLVKIEPIRRGMGGMGGGPMLPGAPGPGMGPPKGKGAMGGGPMMPAFPGPGMGPAGGKGAPMGGLGPMGLPPAAKGAPMEGADPNAPGGPFGPAAAGGLPMGGAPNAAPGAAPMGPPRLGGKGGAAQPF